MRNIILIGDCLEKLKTLPDDSIHCCVTSPPYWGLRDYGVEGQIGLEPDPSTYITRLVEVFREVWRVLRPDGTLWLNIGDSYFGDSPPRKSSGEAFSRTWNPSDSAGAGGKRRSAARLGDLKPKDLVGIPWRVAFALQADGWWLRSDIIWHKPSCMPESVEDRPTRSHEYVFLLTKNERYFYDAAAIREESVTQDIRPPHGRGQSSIGGRPASGAREHRVRDLSAVTTRNKRAVWTINPKPYKGAHFATMPPELAETCIKAGTSEKGCCPACGAPWEREGEGWKPSCTCPEHEPVPCVVLDPFAGSGTTPATAKWLGRDYVGIELNPEYQGLIEERLEPARAHQSEVEAFDLAVDLPQEE